MNTLDDQFDLVPFSAVVPGDLISVTDFAGNPEIPGPLLVLRVDPIYTNEGHVTLYGREFEEWDEPPRIFTRRLAADEIRLITR
jgi:hypothetical protein